MNDEPQTPDNRLTPVEADRLRLAMRRFASGVTVVTSMNDEGPVGITVSAFSSISLDPPVVMVSINTASSAAPVILDSEAFAVHILSSDQEDISMRFAESIPWNDKAAGIDWHTGRSGAPVLATPSTVMECRLIKSLTIGTHTIMFGRVVDIYLSEPIPATPLLYYDQNYRTLDGMPEDPTD